MSIPISKPPIDLTHNNVVNFIIENFALRMNTRQNREKMISTLNTVFFPDNIATFIDRTSEKDIDNGALSIMIDYNGTLYNLLAFQNQYNKINRKRKLLKILKINKIL